MADQVITIEGLARPVGEADLEGLAALLADAVESGAAVSFLAPLSLERARAFWGEVLARAGTTVLVARDASGIVGSVTLGAAWAPNQPHHAEVSKLLVHRRCRRAGVGARLMLALEDQARQAGYTLLTLDAKAGAGADALYRKLGWTEVGAIPGYALDPDGQTLHDTVVFSKTLA